MAAIKKPIKKAQSGVSQKATKDSTAFYSKQASDFGTAAAMNMNRPATANRAFKNQKEALKNEWRQENKGKPGYDKNGFPKKKNGGTVKAKDGGKWIQKAINPAHKGFCTPQTKTTCTPKRKALAQTLRKIAKKK